MQSNLWISDNNNNNKITFDELINNNYYKIYIKLYYHQLEDYKTNATNKDNINNMLNWCNRFINEEYSDLYNWITSSEDPNIVKDPITLYVIQNNLNLDLSEPPSIRTTSSSLNSSYHTSIISSDDNEISDENGTSYEKSN